MFTKTFKIRNYLFFMKFGFLYLILRDISRKKFSTLLTLFAISLGVLAVFVIVIVSSSFQKSITEQFEKVGSNKLYISKVERGVIPQGNKKELSDNLFLEISSKPFIDSVIPLYSARKQIKYGREYKSKAIFGVEFTNKNIEDLGLEVEFGRVPKKNEKYVALVGPDFLSDGFEKDLSLGSKVEIGENKFKIVGIFKSVGNPEDDQNFMLPLNSLREIQNEPEGVTLFYATVQKDYDVLLAKENLQRLLDRRLGKDRVEIQSADQILEQLNSFVQIIQVTLGGIAFVSIIVGALGIINTMYVIVAEKIKDIGIMKACGATNFQILLLFIVQAGIFGLLGAFLGIFLGFFVLIFLEKVAISQGYTFLKITFDFFVVLWLLLFGFFVGVVAGFLPSKQASKQNVVDALRK